MNQILIKTTVSKLAIIALIVLQGMNGPSALGQDGRLGIEPMKKLSHWVGEWEGNGWQMQPSGERIEFSVRESVQSKLNGLVLMMEGKGMSDGSDELGHDAVGMIYHNLDNKRYEFHSTTIQGTTILAEAKFDEDGNFIWGFDIPQGKVQFTITLTEDTWVEKGAFSPDGGGTWYPTMEMNLKKIR